MDCSASGECPIESIAPWLNEHEEESMSVVIACAEDLATACARLTMATPSLLRQADVLVVVVEACLLLGYHRGRTYQDVPKVFKDALEE